MTFLHRFIWPALAVIVASASPARAQDLYDTNILRTLNINFHDANWLTLLRSNYASETNILADLVVDGVTYPSVGVRIRGNTSYTALPTGSQKFSLKIDMDFVDSNQEIMGYDNLNLNNGFHDPTFSREVVYNNYVAQFIPNSRANHVLVTLNGENWGVYINVQQPDKRMLRDYFTNADGMRVKCANNPNGPGLAYNGTNASGYSAYEIQTDGGLADPLAALIAVTQSLSNEPLVTWQNIDSKFAIDPSIWSVALENMLSDDDSYVNKGCDFMTYRDPIDGRMHLIQRDANESFTISNWAVTKNFTAANKPVLSRVLSVPQLRQRYLAHYRTIKQDLNWEYFGPKFTAARTLIDAAVQADTKKLYSYTLFQNNFANSVTLPYSGPAGGTVLGLQQFITQRTTNLNTTTELLANGPTISNAQASTTTPAPASTVYVTASVAALGNPITQVELFYRPNPELGYQRVAMLDNGASGDGAANDGVYGVLLPVAGQPGQRVTYYVAAYSSNSYESVSYLPALAERGPNVIDYTIGSDAGMQITEFMYSGLGGEFIEFTNVSDAPIDMNGWSVDDDHATAHAFDLSALGTVPPGESVIVTETAANEFRTAWGLPETARVIGQFGATSGNNLGRADQIHLFNANGAMVDRLYYGDQTYTGTIRTQNASGQAPCAALGQNDINAWQLSVVGDVYGSHAASSGDIGTPGSYTRIGCSASDVIFKNGFD